MNAGPSSSAGSLSDAPPPYGTPSLECDLVMKGGITSGVVYPKAVVRVARDYRIRKVGGTSVGAIAAALTAAAEHYRRTHPEEAERQWESLNREIEDDLTKPRETAYTSNDPGFAGLYAIPGDIGSNLVRKFQPAPGLRELFEYFIAVAASSKYLKPFTILFWRLFLARSIFAMVFLFLILFIRLNLTEAIRYALPGLAVLVTLSAIPFVVSYVLPVRTRTPLQTMPALVSWLSRAALIFAVFIAIYIVRRIFGQAGAFTPREVFYPLPAIVEQFRNVTAGGPEVANQEAPGNPFLTFIQDLNLAAIEEVRREARENRLTIFVGAIAIILGWIVGGIVALVCYLMEPVKRNFLGICTGLGDEDALTNWLTTKIDRVAGLDSAAPLTFRNLEDQGIAFEAITSDVTRGVPLDLPNALANYEFKPDEFRKFFPENVLRQLGVSERNEKQRDHMPFPDPRDIPVVVVARMSMSFPVLFSAIPVYYEDRETASQRNGDPFRQCWLSDGGVVSNFPVHKFDSALPPCPTFAFDLIQKLESIPGRDSPLKDQVSTNPIVPPQEVMEREMVDLERISAPKMLDLMGLFSGIVNTSRGWMDNSQKKLPGYAERIVGIHLYEGEGGLNLTMSSDTIERLARRGLFGADYLVNAWDPSLPNSEWHQHRWLRYRMLMRELEELGNEWRRIFPCHATPVHDPSIATLVDAYDETANLFYRWNDGTVSENGKRKNTAFKAFANDQATGDDGSVVFRQQKIPELNPKLFAIPPFE